MAISMPGLDFEKGLDFFEGDIDGYMSAIRSFTKNAPASIAKIRDVNKENLAEYAINIHGLKSISAWICAEGVREGAAELDAFAKAGDISAIVARNDKFINDTEAFIKELEVLLTNNKEN